MKVKLPILLLHFCCFITTSFAQAPDRQQFIRVEAPTVVLTHVRVIDGTGAAPLEDQTVVISGGRIQSVGASAAARVPADARVLDLTGYTVLPGLVGMHNHLFFPMGGSPPMYSNMGGSFPRLYLALGVTTIRTTGSVAPYTDLEIKRLIDAGRMIGPKMHVTALDPTGNGGIVAGFGDLRGVELLVEAGFTPPEAIKIATLNGAKFLGEDARIGSIAAGKQADLMVVRGNPAADIADIEKVEIVFKDGVGYDSEKLIQSVQGLVGVR